MDTYLPSIPSFKLISRAKSSRLHSPSLLIGVLRLSDITSIALVSTGIYLYYVDGRADELLSQYIGASIVAIIVWMATANVFSIYNTKFLFSRYLQLRRTLAAWGCTFAVLLAIAFLMKVSSSYSRIWATSWFMGGAGLLVVTRAIMGWLIAAWARQGRLGNRTVIFGGGEQAQRLEAHYDRHPDPRIHLIGLIEEPGSDKAARPDGTVIGSQEELLELIRRNEVDQVLIALPWSEEDSIRLPAATGEPLRPLQARRGADAG